MSRTILRFSAFASSVIAVLAFLGVVFTTAPAASYAAPKVFGNPIDKTKTGTVEISEIYADTSRYIGKKVIVEGKAGQVCQTSGCWLLLNDGGNNQLYVQFYDFTVRLGTGAKLRIQGELRTQNKVPYLVADGLEVVK